MFYIRTNDQVKIAVYDLNPCGSETILLIHGWPLSHQIFEYQEPLLTANGFRVVSMDLRGFGASDAPACGYGYDRMADDIYTVVRALNLRCFTLVGFSMGGGIVTRYMGRYNGYGVKRLVLLGAASPRFTQCSDFPYGVTREAVDAWISQASTDRAQLCEQFGSMLFASPQSSAIVDWLRMLSLGASGIATIQTACALRDEDCRADLSKICVPTGIFHGRQDAVVPFELAAVQQSCIPGAQLFAFENSGHAVFYDELCSFNQQLLAFLRTPVC